MLAPCCPPAQRHQPPAASIPYSACTCVCANVLLYPRRRQEHINTHVCTGWLRAVRPGSVIGPQQQYLVDNEGRMRTLNRLSLPGLGPAAGLAAKPSAPSKPLGSPYISCRGDRERGCIGLLSSLTYVCCTGGVRGQQTSKTLTRSVTYAATSAATNSMLPGAGLSKTLTRSVASAATNAVTSAVTNSMLPGAGLSLRTCSSADGDVLGRCQHVCRAYPCVRACCHIRICFCGDGAGT